MVKEKQRLEEELQVSLNKLSKWEAMMQMLQSQREQKQELLDQADDPEKVTLTDLDDLYVSLQKVVGGWWLSSA